MPAISKEKDHAPGSTCSTSEEKIVSEIDIRNLTIDDSNKFFDETEDSNIKIIASGDAPYTSAFTFELDLSPQLLGLSYLKMLVFDEADHMLAEIDLKLFL
ncbi:hypothetical protein V6Z11_A07G008500 [Gossypium hirsutum]